MTQKGISKPFFEKRANKILLFIFFVSVCFLWIVINIKNTLAYGIIYQQDDDTGNIYIPNNTQWATSSLITFTPQESGFANRITGFSCASGISNASPTSVWRIYNSLGNLIGESTGSSTIGYALGYWDAGLSQYNDPFAYGYQTFNSVFLELGQNYYLTFKNGIGNGNAWEMCANLSENLFSAVITGGSYTTSTYINIVYPNTSSTPDFNSWHIDYSFGTSTLINAGHSVKYSQNLSECVSYNNGTGCYWDFEPTSNESELYAPIVKLNDLSIGNYQAQAFLHNDGVDVATSSIINFYITGQPPISSLFEMPTSTWATSTLPIQITCDPDDNFFQYSLCKLLTFLFVPNSDTLNKFSTLTSGITTKAPLGYFTSISDAISELSSSSPAFSLDIDDNDPLYITFLNPIRTGLTWILWLALAFWLFHRFRHFNLTSP